MKYLAAIAALTMATGQTSPAPSAPTWTGDFCSRLAADSGITRPATPDGRTGWTANAFNFGQRFLVGGTAATGVRVMPIEPATVEDYRRLEHMCLPDPKGAICKLVGPANFKFIWKGRQIVTPIIAGEQATILVRGTKTTCQPGPPPAA